MEEEPPIYRLPHDTLHQIFSSLPLRQIIICRSLSKFFLRLLTTPSFLHLVSATHPPLHLLALRRPRRHSPSHPLLHLFDPDHTLWLRFPLDFLPFRSPLPVASSMGLIYLWAEPNSSAQSQSPSPTTKSLLTCNPFTREFRVLPHLGSAWARHGCVLADGPKVMVLTELAALYFNGNNGIGNGNGNNRWMKFSSNLPSKPRSPVLVGDTVYALCDVGSPWRSQWKLFAAAAMRSPPRPWARIDRREWGDVLDVLRRPRLIRGAGNRVLMVGGLRSSFSQSAPCSAIVVLRLDLDAMEWDEAARMPPEMFRQFRESSKFKAFGASDTVCFSAKRVGKIALWDRRATAEGKGPEWRWIDDVPGNAEGLHRGFVFEGRLNAVP